MRFRFPLSFPKRADGTALPAVLAGLLIFALGIQLMAANAGPELPPVLAVGASRTARAVPTIIPVSAARVIFDRPLFAPRQSLTAAAGGGQSMILGGASVAGTVAIRGRTFAVVRRANGTVSNMAVGGVIDGWRLVSLRPEGAVFVKNKTRQEIRYGAAPAPSTEDDAPAE